MQNERSGAHRHHKGIYDDATLAILLVAGYLVAGLIPGAAVAAVVGIVYIVWASRR